MLYRKQYAQYKFSIILALFCFSTAFSQVANGQPIESIGIRPPLATGYDELNKEVCNYIADEIKAIGKQVDWNSKYELLVSAADISNDRVAVNIVTMSALPKEMLNFNVKHEVFYMNIAKKKELPPEGKNVREYVTRDYVTEFKRPGWGKWIICKKSDLRNECNRFVDDLFKEGWKNMQ